MTATEARQVRAALALSAIGLVLYLIGSSLWPPTFGYDFGNLWLVWRSHLDGAPLGHYLLPDPADLARDRLLPSVTWSSLPAYAVGLSSGFGLPVALLLHLVLLSLATGLGFWQLYARLGFRPVTRALAIAVLLLNWHHVYPFRNFWSGDPYLFAAFPWLVWLALDALRSPRPWQPILAAGLACFAYGAKLSGLLIGALIAAGLLGAALVLVWQSGRWRPLGWSVLLLLAAGLGVLLAQWLFVGGFVNAATTRCGLLAAPWVLIGKSLAFPALGIVGGEAVLNRLWSPWDESAALVVVALGGAILLGWGGWCYARAGQWIALAVLLGNVLALLALLLVGSCVEPLERQFRFAGALLLPWVLEWLGRRERFGPALGWALVALAGTIGAASWIHAQVFNQREGRNPWGLATPYTPAALGQRLLALEAEPGPRWVVFVPSHDWLAYLPRARVALDTMTPTGERLYNPCPREVRHRLGQTARIVVLVPPEHAAACGIQPYLQAFDGAAAGTWQSESIAGWQLLIWRRDGPIASAGFCPGTVAAGDDRAAVVRSAGSAFGPPQAPSDRPNANNRSVGG